MEIDKVVDDNKKKTEDVLQPIKTDLVMSQISQRIYLTVNDDFEDIRYFYVLE